MRLALAKSRGKTLFCFSQPFLFLGWIFGIFRGVCAISSGGSFKKY